MAETKREGAEYHTGAEKAQKTVAATTSTRKRRGTATLATPAHPLKRAKPSSPEQSGCRAEAESKASTHLTALSDVPLAPKTSQALSTRSRPNKGKFGGLAYNVENAGFPRGEIEFHRSGKRIGWNMVNTAALVTPGKILFSSHDWRYGGPFGFLSTHAPCKINVPKLLDGFSFLNVEHAHQYNKARCMKLSEVRITTRISPNVSSRRIVGLVLDARNMTTTEMAEFVDKFNDFYLTDRPWWDEWQSAYLLVVDRVLKYALRAKFESSVDLKMKLMMTGEYELCYANNANSIDPWLGIGFPAHIAMAFQPKWNQNLLGKALMVVRSEIRAKEPQ
ncbi:unnamed protein product [Zymoseptoria tritici ST99CH_1E4]|uniref:NADAR domain-containing protein n=1 Tax=Zymoseptoria tritici ST99CH_1E4 TaxID=1276532 RepID=A0A2H1GSV6_ZYMTR|nr:unnamed protein product [Zymoseptoria tritici ST99CH_1E4]